MSDAPEIVSDDASPVDLGPEPEGWWDIVHDQVAAWLVEFEDDGELD